MYEVRKIYTPTEVYDNGSVYLFLLINNLNRENGFMLRGTFYPSYPITLIPVERDSGGLRN
jgi:hypothetical protein